jgi:hypothetical protein
MSESCLYQQKRHAESYKKSPDPSWHRDFLLYQPIPSAQALHMAHWLGPGPYRDSPEPSSTALLYTTSRLQTHTPLSVPRLP